MKALAVVVLATLVQVGCNAPPRSAQNTFWGGPNSAEMGERVANRGLYGSLKIAHVRHSESDGHMRVEFELLNKSAREIRAEYDVEWFDATGNTLPAIRAWRPLTVGGGGMEVLQARASHPDATSWRLHLRGSNPTH